MSTLVSIKNILGTTLALGDRAQRFTERSFLLGDLAELDSITVIAVIVAIEEYFTIQFEDDEINSAVFQTVGSLVALVDQKRLQKIR